MLTETAIVRAGRKGRKTRYDKDGLYLLIEKSGARGWRWNYLFQGKRKTLSFGPYPLISLEKARTLRDDALRAVRDGKNPLVVRRQLLRPNEGADATTFGAIAEDWLKTKHGGSAATTKKKLRWFLDMIVLPALGQKQITAIEPPDILATLQPLEARGKHESAHKVRQMCGQIFRYAIAKGWAKRDMAADVSDALAAVVVTSYAAITDPLKVGALLRALDALPETTAVGVAMRLAPLVFLRPGELRHAEWSEINLDEAMWRIPAAKMKLRKDHLVPLSRQAIVLLKIRQRSAVHSKFVFASPRASGRPLSDNAFNSALRQLGTQRIR